MVENKIGSCPSELNCFPCALDIDQSKNTFYEISAFFKHNFCLTPLWKINWPRWFFLYFSLKSLGVVLIPGAKLVGHWVWGPLDPGQYVFVVFSYLLNVCREWYLFKFLISDDLSPHLFGLIFRVPLPRKWWLGSTGVLRSINMGFFKTLFFEK